MCCWTTIGFNIPHSEATSKKHLAKVSLCSWGQFPWIPYMLQTGKLQQLSLVLGKIPAGNTAMAGLGPGSGTAVMWLLRTSSIFPTTWSIVWTIIWLIPFCRTVELISFLKFSFCCVLLPPIFVHEKKTTFWINFYSI